MPGLHARGFGLGRSRDWPYFEGVEAGAGSSEFERQGNFGVDYFDFETYFSCPGGFGVGLFDHHARTYFDCCAAGGVGVSCEDADFEGSFGYGYGEVEGFGAGYSSVDSVGFGASGEGVGFCSEVVFEDSWLRVGGEGEEERYRGGRPQASTRVSTRHAGVRAPR